MFGQDESNSPKVKLFDTSCCFFSGFNDSYRLGAYQISQNSEVWTNTFGKNNEDGTFVLQSFPESSQEKKQLENLLPKHPSTVVLNNWLARKSREANGKFHPHYNHVASFIPSNPRRVTPQKLIVSWAEVIDSRQSLVRIRWLQGNVPVKFILMGEILCWTSQQNLLWRVSLPKKKCGYTIIY